jgi:succinyl-CoA:acetate CoA-transferase
MEDGGIVPTTSVGGSPTFVREADGVIVEINTAQPMELNGMHDIYMPDSPPDRGHIPITDPSQRIGAPAIPCDPDKIIAICRSDMPDKTRPLTAVDDISQGIARHLVILSIVMFAGDFTRTSAASIGCGRNCPMPL